MCCQTAIWRGIFFKHRRLGEEDNILVRIIALALIAIWLVLVLLGKGGFVHVLLLTGVVIGTIDAVSLYRCRMTQT